MLGEFKDHRGKKYGMLSPIRIVKKVSYWSKTEFRNKHRAVWLCKCDCGNFIEIKSCHFTSGNTSSCGCLKRKLLIQFNKEAKRIEKGEAAFNALFRRYIYDAKKRDISWKLSKNKFRKLVTSDCEYCGSPPLQIERGNWSNFKYNGLDRKNNKFGYSIKNVVSCCGKCNTMKMDLSYDNFLFIALKISLKHYGIKQYKIIPDKRKTALERNIKKQKTTMEDWNNRIKVSIWSKTLKKLPKQKRLDLLNSLKRNHLLSKEMSKKFNFK